VEQTLTEQLTTLGIQRQSFWGATLYHPDELPFPLAQLPDVFTQFRKRVERTSTVYPPVPGSPAAPGLADGPVTRQPSPLWRIWA
jgi:deoxyribodipyrimidine photo-lyase